MRQSGRKPMAVSIEQARRDRPAPEIAPVPTAGSKAMRLKFEIQPATNPTSEKERAARLVDPGFGRIFTDHMAVVRYSQAKGWHGARVESRANFPLDPATAVLHYAQEIFEGLKAYRRDDGGVNLFRPDANARRFGTRPIAWRWRRCRSRCSSKRSSSWCGWTAPGFRAARAACICGPS